MKTTARQIMIVAGEASGDLHAAKLVRAILESGESSAYSFFGSAGPSMRAAGVDPVVYADHLSIVGLIEIGRALPMFWKARKKLLAAARDRKPDIVVLIDFPDFNLKMVKPLKKLGIKVVYYISPQVWAWRKYRSKLIRDHVDLLLTILPFEKDWFLSHGVSNVEYVGSPLARDVFPTRSKEDFCGLYKLDPHKPIVALLPGSRQKEISRILPVMIETAVEIWHPRPEVQFAVAAASPSSRAQIARIIDKSSHAQENLRSIPVLVDETYNLLNASDAAAVTSGTATMEAGIIGTPLVIVYKTSGINYALLEPLISVEHYGLINMVAGERVATELIQHEFTPSALSDEIYKLLDPDENVRHRGKLRVAAKKLGSGGASKRAAGLITELIREDGG